jgi:hypothetical protein
MIAAPYEPCIGCDKGGTTTAFAIRGEPEFAAAVLQTAADISPEEAAGAIEVWAELECGYEPGKLPDWLDGFVFRLCRDCAGKTGAKVAGLSGDVQPGDAWDDAVGTTPLPRRRFRRAKAKRGPRYVSRSDAGS